VTTAKERIVEIVQQQPDDSSYEEILRELAFARMIDRGLADSREGRTVSNGTTNPYMAKINWTNEAEKWLRDIHDHIAQDNPGAADRVVAGIYKQAQVLAAFPGLGYKYRELNAP
jgi:hypothetical protein